MWRSWGRTVKWQANIAVTNHARSTACIIGLFIVHCVDTLALKWNLRHMSDFFVSAFSSALHWIWHLDANVPQLMRQHGKYLPICSWSSHEIWGRGRPFERMTRVQRAPAAESHYQFVGSEMPLSTSAEGSFLFFFQVAKLNTRSPFTILSHQHFGRQPWPAMCYGSAQTCQHGSQHWAAAECNIKPGQISHFWRFFLQVFFLCEHRHLLCQKKRNNELGLILRLLRLIYQSKNTDQCGR